MGERATFADMRSSTAAGWRIIEREFVWYASALPRRIVAHLEPFVSEANLWMVQQHGIFQGHYFFHHLGMDRNLRDPFKGSLPT